MGYLWQIFQIFKWLLKTAFKIAIFLFFVMFFLWAVGTLSPIFDIGIGKYAVKIFNSIKSFFNF